MDVCMIGPGFVGQTVVSTGDGVPYRISDASSRSPTFTSHLGENCGRIHTGRNMSLSWIQGCDSVGVGASLEQEGR